jgi:polar amino acid transport system substrate-binding protein
MLLAIVLAVSGCTSPTPTAAPTETPSATPTVTPNETAAYNFTTKVPGKLIMPIDVPYPPMEQLNTTTNEYSGFDVEWMRAIANELNLSVEFMPYSFPAIPPAIQTGENNFEASISSFSVTPERAEVVDFTDPYFTSSQSVAVKFNENTIKNVSDLAGKKIGVQTGTTGALAAENITGVTTADIQYFDTIDGAFTALKAGQVDAVVNDFPISAYYVMGNPNDYKFAVTGFGDEEYYAIIVSKDNPGLRNAINSAMEKLKSDGTYQTIYDKYFKTT